MLQLDKYSYNSNSSFLDYEFDSIGIKGIIKKVARFTSIGNNLYNFGFGDLDLQTGEIDDTIVSNNGDGDKILATVAAIIFDFTNHYLEGAVFIKGSTATRTRRYQMGINKFWEQINPVFEIIAYQNEKWEHFKKQENYEAFIGRRKTSFLF